MRETEKTHLIENAVKNHADEIISWRRHLHQNPELSFEEFETAEFIAGKLREMGLLVKEKIGGTGVLAMLETEKPGPVIAFRADMDALPMLEATDLPYASLRGGVMHGCGHDVHMAVLLGTAQVLCDLKEHLAGCIKFIFQPGEEANGGAKCMINDGVLKDPPVEAIFALHANPHTPAGTIALRKGYTSATDDEVNIRIYGASAHSSSPEEGVNAIMIAANILTALQSIQAGNISPYDIATFSICKIRGGEAINVLADYAEMSGMIRCIEKENKMIFRNRITQLSESIAKAYGGKAEVDFIEGFPAVYNDTFLTELVTEAARKALHSPEDVILLKRPHLGSEDFSYYQEEIPGALFLLGVGKEGEDRGSLHSTILNINEESLAYGIKVFVNTAFAFSS